MKQPVAAAPAYPTSFPTPRSFVAPAQVTRPPIAVVGAAALVGLGTTIAIGGVLAGFNVGPVALAAAGAALVVGAMLSTEVGIGGIMAALALTQREQLESIAIPFFGGGLKPTDILLLATLGGWILRMLMRSASRESVAPRALPQPATALLIGFVAWAAIGSALGVAHDANYKDSLLELRPLLHFLLVLPIIMELDRAAVRRLVWFLILLSPILAVKALLEYARGEGGHALYTADIRIMDVDFAYLTFAIVLTLSLYAAGERRRLLLATISALALCGLAVTFYRSAALGLAAGIITIFALLERTGRRRFAVVVGGVGMAGIVAALVYAGVHGGGRDPLAAIVSRVASIGDYSTDVSAQHRLHEWAAAREMIAAHPIVGNGLGARVGFHSPMYSDLTKQRGYWSHDVYMHNSYMWLLTKMGLIGFVSILTVVALALQHAWHRIRSMRGGERGIPIGIAACLVTLVVVSFFGPMLTGRTTVPFAAFAIGSLYVWWPARAPLA